MTRQTAKTSITAATRTAGRQPNGGRGVILAPRLPALLAVVGLFLAASLAAGPPVRAADQPCMCQDTTENYSLGCVCSAAECTKACAEDHSCSCTPTSDPTCPCTGLTPAPGQNTGKAIEKLPAPALSVPIPLLQLSEAPVSDQGGGITTISIPWIVQYLSGLYRWLVGIVGMLAAVMMMIGGFQYMTAGGDLGKVGKGKQRITDALTGLVLTVGAYLLLNAVNPNLVSFGSLTIQKLEQEKFEGITYVPPADFLMATGKPVPNSADVNKTVMDMAAASGDDPCEMKSVVGKESGGRPDAIGHDENVARKGCNIGARCRFISSGKKFSGSPFENYLSSGKAKGSAYMDLVYNGGFVNDDTGGNRGKLDFSRPDLGMDLRFTHGVGLGQVTLLYDTRGADLVGTVCPSGRRGRVMGGKCYDIADLLDPQKTMEASIRIFQQNKRSCGGNLYCAFVRYNGSGCAARGSACAKLKAYAACKGNPGLAAGQPSNCYAWDAAFKSKIITNSDCKNLSFQLPQQ